MQQPASSRDRDRQNAGRIHRGKDGRVERACIMYITARALSSVYGVFRPASTWRHNPVPFISQVPGGYYAGLTPPFIPVFVSFYFAYTTTANG